MSPSTSRIELLLKRERLQSAGCPSYWVVDPDEPSILAWDLIDGVYEEVGRAAGVEQLQLNRPVDVVVTPAELVG